MNCQQAMENLNLMHSKLKEYFVAGEKVLKPLWAGIIAGGHLLFEDNPGLGKTFLVKLLAGITGCSWKRVQFTPDLLPADIVGTRVWKPRNGDFSLEKGPVFTNFLLADEINRAMPKTQSALLEAMEERQVTIEGQTYFLGSPFLVLATQNPIENEGTYPLPEAQMDRFIMKLSLGYAQTLEEECEIIRRRIKWGRDDPSREIEPVMTQEKLLELQRQGEKIMLDENVQRYIGDLVRNTREDSRIRVGASPRGSLALLKLSRALALMNGRDYVLPDDVNQVAFPALVHRLVLDMEYYLEGGTAEKVLEEIVERVEVPRDYHSGGW